MRKNITFWALYDFANSFVMIIFLFYFSQRLVVERGVSEFWYNFTMVAVSIIFILIAPYLGKLVDQGANKLKGLRLRTLISVAFFAICGSMALWTPQYTFIITVLYCLAMITYLLCFIYYTPMLNDLASTKGNNAQISGRGQGVNSLGQILGLLISIPLIHGAIPALGAERASTLLPAAILFLLFALPMLFRYDAKEQPIPQQLARKTTRSYIKDLFSHKAIIFFFLGYFFYVDAIVTFGNNFPLYLEKVHMMADTLKSVLTAAILLCASVSAFVTGKLADRVGLKKSLLFVLGAMCIILPVFAFIKGFTALAVMSCLAGIFYGPVRSISRALLSKITPQRLAGSGFTFYTLAERFATLIGPLVRGGVVTGLGGGRVGYSRALISMSLLILVGRFSTNRIKMPKAITE